MDSGDRETLAALDRIGLALLGPIETSGLVIDVPALEPARLPEPESED